MKRPLRAAALVLTLALWGCYESQFPLGPPEEGTIDRRLPGNWRCLQSGEGENKPFLLSIIPFDGKQYYAGLLMEGEKPVHYRAFSASVKGMTLLNVQEINSETVSESRRWIFVRYSLLRPNVLLVEIVKDAPFKGIDASPLSVREVVERDIRNPELYQDFCTCVKIGEKKE